MFLPTDSAVMPFLVFREIGRREQMGHVHRAAPAGPPRAYRRRAGIKGHRAVQAVADEAVHWFDSPVGPDHPGAEPEPFSRRERCDLLRIAWERYPNAANDSVALVRLYHEGMTPEGKARFDATDWPAL